MSSKPNPKHVHGYQQMLQRINDHLDHAEEDSESALHEAYENARETAVELGELTHEEAEQIKTSVQRDLEDAGHFVNKTGKAIHDWLAFDWMLVEDKLWDLFSMAVDKTRLQLILFNQEMQLGPRYHTGEMTGPGSLQCHHCGEVVQFKQVSHIPPCPECHSSEYSRLSNS